MIGYVDGSDFASLRLDARVVAAGYAAAAGDTATARMLADEGRTLALGKGYRRATERAQAILDRLDAPAR